MRLVAEARQHAGQAGEGGPGGCGEQAVVEQRRAGQFGGQLHEVIERSDGTGGGGALQPGACHSQRQADLVGQQELEGLAAAGGDGVRGDLDAAAGVDPAAAGRAEDRVAVEGEPRRADGYRVTLLAFLMKAAVSALREFPRFNSSLTPEKDALIYKSYYHLGVAVDTPEGLVVPVIRDVDRKGITELSQELGAVSARARDGKLDLADLQGACFTISSLGGIGGTAFTPIVNAPEVAILGVVRARMTPAWDGTAFVPRLMLPVSLSYDHRVIDGALAARFARHLCQVMEDIRRLLL